MANDFNWTDELISITVGLACERNDEDDGAKGKEQQIL